MSIINYEDISVSRLGTVTRVLGRTTEGAPSVFASKGSMQPLDRLEVGAITLEMEVDGDRIRRYKKMYTETEMMLEDEITEDQTGLVYIVKKVYDYSGYGMIVDHFKAIIYMAED